MTKQTRRRFSPEYKEQSVARLSEPGATHSRVAEERPVRRCAEDGNPLPPVALIHGAWG